MTAAVREEQIPAEFLYWEHVDSRARRNRWYANEPGAVMPIHAGEEFRR